MTRKQKPDVWLEPLTDAEKQQLRVHQDQLPASTAVNEEEPAEDIWQRDASPPWLRHTGLIKAGVVFVSAYVGLQMALMVAGAWSYHWSLGTATLLLVGAPAGVLLHRLWRARGNAKRVEKLTGIRVRAAELNAQATLGQFAPLAKQLLPLLDSAPLRAVIAAQPERLGDYANDAEYVQDLDLQLVILCDKQARNEVVRATRRTALSVAASPFLALDLFMALANNMSLIGRIAKAYGLPASPFLEAKLLVQVYRQVALLGAIEIGTEVAGEALSHEVLARLSGRVAQGFSAGLYTYRIGIIAMQLCRPVDFSVATQPKAGSVFRDIFRQLEADEL